MATTQTSQDGTTPRRGLVGYALVETVAFLSELGMFAALGLAGWRLGNGGLISIALAALYPALAVLIWSMWLAPRAVNRLADPSRLIVQIMLFLVTGVASAFAGRLLWGIVAAVGIVAFAAARRYDRERDVVPAELSGPAS